jgi:hypothetical protein
VDSAEALASYQAGKRAHKAALPAGSIPFSVLDQAEDGQGRSRAAKRSDQ